MHSIRLPSYAKINLGLRIIGRRADGFHEIETLLQQISLHDDIVLEDMETPQITFHCDSPGIPTGEDNICVKAAKLLSETGSVKRGISIRLNKRIPVGAGLGGGSSNGAVVLMGLNELWNLNLAEKDLLRLAAELGSDVPFFIRGGTAIARGRGEILTSLTKGFDMPVLLIYPEIEISTKWAYQQLNLSLTMKKKASTLMSFKDINFNNVDFNSLFYNEFENVVFNQYPLLRDIKDTVGEQQSVFASMSGSGSSIFGIFQKRRQAEQARALFQNRYKTFLVKPILGGRS
ncbi:4-(cytidine 5'-diphospho)-2-C-methyl-D-erythritol kinase [bacterium]|nr:4-(cytidine 5'-diphospho)-2-C-methyl-D-erythritol kinase [bacterium]